MDKTLPYLPFVNPARPIYLREMDADPQGIGFAYGGVTPGRLHAHGKLVDFHQVRLWLRLAEA